MVLAKQRFNLRERDLQALNATFVLSAQTRMSGVNVQERMIRKGAVDAIRRHVESIRGTSRGRWTIWWKAWRAPLVGGGRRPVLGVVALKDIVKGGIRNASMSCARWASKR